MTLLDRVHHLLSARLIPHALVGAAALAARGIARSTYDIDLLTTDRRVLEPGLWSALQDEGVSVEIRRGDDDDPLGGVVRLDCAAERPVDVILGKFTWQSGAIARAESLSAGPAIVTTVDLILLKLYAGGTQDLWDVHQLLQLPGNDALRRSLDLALAGMPQRMRELWDQVRRDV